MRDRVDRLWILLIRDRKHYRVAKLLALLKAIKLDTAIEFDHEAEDRLEAWDWDRAKRKMKVERREDSIPKSPKNIKPTKARRF